MISNINISAIFWYILLSLLLFIEKPQNFDDKSIDSLEYKISVGININPMGKKLKKVKTLALLLTLDNNPQNEEANKKP